MVKVNFVQPDGTRSEVEAPVGYSGMQAAQQNGVPGIVAECGGSACCATCHVYVSDEDLPRLPPVSVQEDQMLDCTASERQPNSRLSCQITLTEALDGLTLRIPETQL